LAGQALALALLYSATAEKRYSRQLGFRCIGFSETQGIKKLGLLDPGLRDEELTISYEGL
jgi:hypothetical protein